MGSYFLCDPGLGLTGSQNKIAGKQQHQHTDEGEKQETANFFDNFDEQGKQI